MTSSQPDATAETILIVDDAPDTLRFLSKLLTQQGYKTRRVINGQLALDSARLEPPDLILLDIMMPHINGYEVCKRLKQDDRTRHIPVVFLSALDEELDKVQAFQVGGIDYVTKPFQVMEVLSRVETHLNLSRTKQQLQSARQQLEQEISQRLAIETAFRILNEQVEFLRQPQHSLKSNPEPRDQSNLESALADALMLSQIRGDLLATITRDVQASVLESVNAVERLTQNLAANSSLSQMHLTTIRDNLQKISRLFKEIQPIAAGELLPSSAHFIESSVQSQIVPSEKLK